MLSAMIVIGVSCMVVLLAMVAWCVYQDNRREDRLLDDVRHIDGVKND